MSEESDIFDQLSNDLDEAACKILTTREEKNGSEPTLPGMLAISLIMFGMEMCEDLGFPSTMMLEILNIELMKNGYPLSVVVDPTPPSSNTSS